MPEFTMPSLGADMDEGTLVEWLVRPGDEVHRGDVVAVVETSKSTIEVECFDSGMVERLLVDPGVTVPVGTALAVIAPAAAGKREPEPGPGPAPPAGPPPEPTAAPQAPRAPGPQPAPEPAGREPAAEPPPPPPPPPPEREPEPEAEPAGVSSPLVRHLADHKGVDLAALHGTGPGGRITRSDVERADLERAAPARGARVAASPLARRLADELRVDLAQVPGTGRNGTVRAADVRNAAAPEATGRRPAPPAAPAPAPPAPRRKDEKAASMRRSIGDLMSRSKREIPHYYLSTTIDLAAALEWMRERNRQLPVDERLVPAALLLKAAAVAARQVPELNGFWTAQAGFVPGTGVHLGVAVALRGGGLVAPALHDADSLTVPELMTGLRDVVARARAGRLRGSEAADPTITVTNLGDQGVESVFGVIYPPQVALVGLGRVVQRPWAVDGLLGVRPTVTATLSADHRASDGAVGARYLTALDRLLQIPEEL